MSDQLVEKQVVYDGKKVRLEVHHLDSERSGKRLKREVVVHPGAVTILGLLPDERVILIRNKRYSVGQTLIELPAGTLEKNEDPMNCAGREMLEETGYLPGKLHKLGVFYTSPGILTERMYCFVATNLVLQKQALEADEEIEVMPVPMSEAIEMIQTGQILDGKTIAALLMYDRFKKA